MKPIKKLSLLNYVLFWTPFPWTGAVLLTSSFTPTLPAKVQYCASLKGWNEKIHTEYCFWESCGGAGRERELSERQILRNTVTLRRSAFKVAVKTRCVALVSVAPWVGRRPAKRTSPVSPFWVRSGHVPGLWGWRGPGRCAQERQPIDISLSHRCSSVPSALAKNQ